MGSPPLKVATKACVEGKSSESGKQEKYSSAEEVEGQCTISYGSAHLPVAPFRRIEQRISGEDDAILRLARPGPESVIRKTRKKIGRKCRLLYIENENTEKGYA